MIDDTTDPSEVIDVAVGVDDRDDGLDRAMGEVQIELDHNGKAVRGRGISTDILEASALAYISAINRLRSASNRQKLVTQHSGV